MKTLMLSLALAGAVVAAGTGVAAAKPGQGERGAMMAARLAEMDADKNGKITKAEAESVRVRMFTRLDADKNGVVTRAEMDAARAAMKGDHDGGMRGMERLDGDKDGQITKAEALAAPYPMFQRLDANGDGVIDKAELPKRGGT